MLNETISIVKRGTNMSISEFLRDILNQYYEKSKTGGEIRIKVPNLTGEHTNQPTTIEVPKSATGYTIAAAPKTTGGWKLPPGISL